MYQAELGRFITRDPLPQAGQPDVLYDNNEFGRWLDMMKNLYGYCDDNPINATDSTGLYVDPRPYDVSGGGGCPPVEYEWQPLTLSGVYNVGLSFTIFRCECKNEYDSNGCCKNPKLSTASRWEPIKNVQNKAGPEFDPFANLLLEYYYCICTYPDGTRTEEPAKEMTIQIG